jgi:tetratricopeptide (TPR) repeat protein
MRISGVRFFLVLVVAGALLYLLVRDVIQPARLAISDRYVVRGDALFEDEDYTEAVTQYQEALQYDDSNRVAQLNDTMAKSAPTDPAAAAPFFEAHGMTAALSQLAEAQKAYANPQQALQVGVTLYDEAQYALAQYPLQRATVLDSAYPAAWNYLGLTYQKLEPYGGGYAAKAAECFAKRDNLTPVYIENK